MGVSVDKQLGLNRYDSPNHSAGIPAIVFARQGNAPYVIPAAATTTMIKVADIIQRSSGGPDEGLLVRNAKSKLAEAYGAIKRVDVLGNAAIPGDVRVRFSMATPSLRSGTDTEPGQPISTARAFAILSETGPTRMIHVEIGKVGAVGGNLVFMPQSACIAGNSPSAILGFLQDNGLVHRAIRT